MKTSHRLPKAFRLTGLALLLVTTLATAAPCDDVASLRQQS